MNDFNVYKAVRDSVEKSLGPSVENSVYYTVRSSVDIFVWYPARGSVESDANDSIKAFIKESIRDCFENEL